MRRPSLRGMLERLEKSIPSPLLREDNEVVSREFVARARGNDVTSETPILPREPGRGILVLSVDFYHCVGRILPCHDSFLPACSNP